MNGSIWYAPVFTGTSSNFEIMHCKGGTTSYNGPNACTAWVLICAEGHMGHIHTHHTYLSQSMPSLTAVLKTGVQLPCGVSSAW